MSSQSSLENTKDQIVNPEKTEPMTWKDRIITLAVAILLIGLCVCIWLWPDYIASQNANPSGRGGRKILYWINLIWNRPVGSVAGVLGLITFLSAFRKEKEVENTS